MSGNSFGKLFSVTTFGESHGKAIGCIVDGCPPGYKVSEKDIQPDLNRESQGSQNIQLKGKKMIRLKFYLEHLKV